MRRARLHETKPPRPRAVSALENPGVARQRDYFLSIASHELKTHLTPLRLQVGLLEELAHSSDAHEMLHRKVQAYSDRLARQVDRLSQFVDELLDVSCMNAGQLRLERSKICLSSVVREVVERFSQELKLSGSKLCLSLNGGMFGYWDRSRLEQVIANLFTNAIKYGRGRPIEIATYAEGDNAILRIADKGIGIREEDQDRIFGLYERAVQPDHFRGTGLGLYIVRRITEAHGGKLALVSRFGKGSTFQVSLPRNEVEFDRVAQIDASRHL